MLDILKSFTLLLRVTKFVTIYKKKKKKNWWNNFSSLFIMLLRIIEFLPEVTTKIVFFNKQAYVILIPISASIYKH